MPSATTVLLRTQTDERLVALARSGHERAFEAIVERYRRPLLRACRRVLPEARAEDAVQQALVAAWAGLQRGDEVREVRPWLYRIARNAALNQLRVTGYDHAELHELLGVGPAPEEVLERRDVARRTLAGLAALPERQREALLGVAVQGRGQEEVAAALGISEPAVRQLVHRARTRLRAAATAVMPMPLAGWLADAGSRADLVAGGGAAATAKLGAVLALAGGGAVVAPTGVDHFDHGAVRAAAPKPTPALVAEHRPSHATAAPEHAAAPTAAVHGGRSPSGSSGRGGPGPSGGGEVRRSGSSGSDGDDRSGPSGSGDDRTGSSGGDDRRGSSDGGGTSGSSGSDDHVTSGVEAPSSSGGTSGSSSGSDDLVTAGSGTSGSSSGSDDLVTSGSGTSGSSGGGDDHVLSGGDASRTSGSGSSGSVDRSSDD